MDVANVGDAAAEDVTATIVLPDGLTFAAPSGGAAPTMAVQSLELSNFVRFALDGEFAVGDWTCTLSADSSIAACTLDSLDIGAGTSLGLDLTIAGALPEDAQTSFSVSQGDQTLSYSVRTGIETNEENIDPIYVADGHIAALHVGATVMGCDTAEFGCAGVMSGVGSTKLNNNDWDMVALNEAGGVSNSAATQLSIPAGATVKYATLEWAANRYNGSSAPVRPADAFAGALDSARLRVPGGDYVAVTADTVNQTEDPAGRIYYQSRLDITDLVKEHGTGEWALADIALPSTRHDNDKTYFGGFAITVVYEDPSLADSRLTIFDGAEWVSVDNKADFTFATTVPSKVTLGWVSFEGDRGTLDDRLDINGDTFTPCRWDGTGVTLGDSGNAADSTAFGGQHANTLGTDAKLFRPNTVPAGTHEVTVRTGGDNYLLSTLTVAISNDTSGPSTCSAP
jgi:hypothetical protein